MSIGPGSWRERLGSLLGFNLTDYCFLILTVREPWTHESLRKVAKPAPFLIDLAHATPGIKQEDIHLTDVLLFKHFPFVGMMLEKARVRSVKELSFIKYAFEPERHCYWEAYVRILLSLSHLIDEKNHVANLSLQPLKPYSFEPNEPLNVATRIAMSQGLVQVFAAGNYGHLGHNTLSPWSVAPWVVGVGAASSDGTRLWEGSSRGIPGDSLYHPTVVAPGIDVIAAGGVHTGTSFAVPQITAIAALCIEFLNIMTSSAEAQELCKALQKEDPNFPQLESSPQLVKAMLEDMAIEMTGYDRHEVGAGFVNEEIARKYLQDFSGINLIRLLASVRQEE